jgi:hypothetical protein
VKDFLQTLRMLDPLLPWCLYLAALCIGMYLILITHPRVKPPRHGVYYNSRRDDSVPPTQTRANRSADERD